MQQLAERLVGGDVELAEIPGRLLVAAGQPQKKIAGGGDPPRDRQVSERAERMVEPAAGKLRPETPGSERGVLSLVQAVEHRWLIADILLRCGKRCAFLR